MTYRAEFEIVIANGSPVTANEIENPDRKGHRCLALLTNYLMLVVFWALRGSGAGSWGVVISTSFPIFPTFEAVHHHTTIFVISTEDVSALIVLHANHIFYMDHLHLGQYFYWTATPPSFTWNIDTIFPNTSIAAANASPSLFLNVISNLGILLETSLQPDIGEVKEVIGSRLWPDSVYLNNVTDIGRAYKALFEGYAYVVPSASESHR